GTETANAGNDITYDISVFNNGPSDAQNVVLTDQAPPGTSPQSFNQISGVPFNITFNGVDTYTAQAASLAPGETAIFQMVVRVNRNVLNGAILTNGVSVTSNTPDPDTNSNTATASTTVTNTTHIVISEFRFRGEGGARDEFIEIYNDSDSPVTVQSTDESGGWAIVAAVDNTVRCAIPNNTVIPARGHFLCVNSAGYSLNGYPAGTSINAVGNATYTTGIPDDDGVGLFSSQNCFCGATLLDSVGFSSVTNPLFREGTGLGLPVASNAQFSFVRRLQTGTPQDTNGNAEDFVLVATDPLAVGNSAQLGAPGPENTFSPTQRNATIKASLIAPQQSSTAFPNRARVGTPVANGAYGTLSIRRRFTNATGQMLTRLRFRAVNMTTFGTPISLSPQADMRLLTSGDFGITVNDNTLSVRGTIVEQPPAQPLGGGLNSTASVMLPGGGLAPGASVDVQFLLGVQQEGIFRFLINIEGLTNPPTFADSANKKSAGGK
ncbi:MAG TPA: lamin tail domain-containing protein, partial [Pyrinomonadaceae bacterium]|nr:lamin tail domain-containing protein [Pyrinomonadaceae bacterium]